MRSVRNRRWLAYLLCLILAMSGVDMVGANENQGVEEGVNLGNVEPESVVASGAAITFENVPKNGGDPEEFNCEVNTIYTRKWTPEGDNEYPDLIENKKALGHVKSPSIVWFSQSTVESGTIWTQMNKTDTFTEGKYKAQITLEFNNNENPICYFYNSDPKRIEKGDNENLTIEVNVAVNDVKKITYDEDTTKQGYSFSRVTDDKGVSKIEEKKLIITYIFEVKESALTPSPETPTPESPTPSPGTPTPAPPTSNPSASPTLDPSVSSTPSPTPTVTPAPSGKPFVKIKVVEMVEVIEPGDNMIPISDAEVVVMRAEDGKKIKVPELVNESGSYVVNDLEDGTYTISVTMDGYERNEDGKFEVKDGKINIDSPYEIVIGLSKLTTPTPGPTITPTPSPILTVTIPAPQLKKKGAKVSVKVTASISNAPKENYTFQYAWTWNGTRNNSNKDSISKAVTNVGENTWKCNVTAVGNDGNKLTKKVEGVVIGYQSSGVKLTLLKKYSNKEIVNAVFKSSGVSVKKIKKSSYLEVKKNSVRAKKFKKSLSVSLEGIRYGNAAFGNISVKMEMHLPLEVKFTKKNGGKKIVCSFSKDLRKIVKNNNKKKYGIKQVKVKIWFSKNGKDFQAVMGAAKKYFQPTVAKSKCYITQKTKFKTKKFKADIVCKASGGTVKDKMKVTYK